MKHLISLVSALALVSIPAVAFSKEAVKVVPLPAKDASAKATSALTPVPAPKPTPKPTPKSAEDSQRAQKVASEEARGGSKLSLSLMFGGGLGMINADARFTDQPESNVDEGLALSSIHLNLEVDYRLAERFQLGVFARAQSAPTLLGGLQGQYRWLNGDRVSLSARLGVGYGTLSYDVPVFEVDRFGSQGSREGQMVARGILYKVGNLLRVKVGSYVELLGSVDFLHVLPLNACPARTGDESRSEPVIFSCDSSTRHFDFNLGVSYLF